MADVAATSTDKRSVTLLATYNTRSVHAATQRAQQNLRDFTGCVQWLTELLLSYPNLTTWLNIKSRLVERKFFKIHARISDGCVRAQAFINVLVFIARVSELNEFLGSVLSV